MVVLKYERKYCYSSINFFFFLRTFFIIVLEPGFTRQIRAKLLSNITLQREHNITCTVFITV